MPESNFEYEYFMLPDITTDMLAKHNMEVRLEVAYSSSAYTEWAAARPELLLLKASPPPAPPLLLGLLCLNIFSSVLLFLETGARNKRKNKRLSGSYLLGSVAPAWGLWLRLIWVTLLIGFGAFGFFAISLVSRISLSLLGFGACPSLLSSQLFIALARCFWKLCDRISLAFCLNALQNALHLHIACLHFRFIARYWIHSPYFVTGFCVQLQGILCPLSIVHCSEATSWCHVAQGGQEAMPSTHNYTFKQLLEAQNTTYEINLCPSQLKQVDARLISVNLCPLLMFVNFCLSFVAIEIGPGSC